MSDDTQYKYEVFKCDKPLCNFICYTLNQLHEHSLDKHSTVYIPKYTVNGISIHKDKKDESTSNM